MRSPSGSSLKLRNQTAVSSSEYETLAEFRYQLATFLCRRREAAVAAGLKPQQYELLLAIKGFPDGIQPNIKQIAEQLMLEHHSAAELAGRLVKRGLIRRQRPARDKRSVMLSLTKHGERALEQVAQYSLSQLKVEAPALLKSLGRILRLRLKTKRKRS